MLRILKVVLPLVLMLLLSTSAKASYSAWWAVDWASGTRTITYNLANYSTLNQTANISGAMGREYDGSGSGANWVQYSPVFCVDLFHYAYDNWTNRYDVEVYTGADGNAGWLTPDGDYDQLRDPNGLRRAAELAQYYGTTWQNTDAIILGTSDADRNNRAIALNVAIWHAAYGSNFTYVSGLTSAQMSWYNKYMTHYDLGIEEVAYRWWDSSAGDLMSERQDFLKGEIPEPTSLMLLGVLITGSALLAVRRRKRS